MVCTAIPPCFICDLLTIDRKIGDITPARGAIHMTRMMGPIPLSAEAESCRRQLATWTASDRIAGEDYTIDYHGHRVYVVSKFKPIADRLLQAMNREVSHTKSSVKQSGIFTSVEMPL